MKKRNVILIILGIVVLFLLFQLKRNIDHCYSKAIAAGFSPLLEANTEEQAVGLSLVTPAYRARLACKKRWMVDYF